MSALHGHISDSPTLNLLYMWALSLLCPVLNLNRITCSGLFSLWRLSDKQQQQLNVQATSQVYLRGSSALGNCACFHDGIEFAAQILQVRGKGEGGGVERAVDADHRVC